MPKHFVTHDKATKRICPVSLNSPDGTLDCKASLCMAWRWGPSGRSGYCGLAGYPTVFHSVPVSGEVEDSAG
jgi:hypothetical protein